MNRIECLREKLHKAIEGKDPENVLRASRELDKLIVVHMRKSTNIKRKS